MNVFEHDEIFGEQGLEFRAVAIIGVDGSDKRLAVFFEQGRKQFEIGNALGVTRLRRGKIGRALVVEAGPKFGGNRNYFWRRHGSVHGPSSCLHGILLNTTGRNLSQPCRLLYAFVAWASKRA